MGCGNSKAKAPTPQKQPQARPPVAPAGNSNITNNTNNTNPDTTNNTNTNPDNNNNTNPDNNNNNNNNPDNNKFQHGSPSAIFPYDEARPCTERGNGLLFRLINHTTKQWAYYNDSRKFEFHITVVFSAHSSVTGLGGTTVRQDPSDGRTIATTIVYPRQTEVFVQGEVDGFDAEYQAVVLTHEYREKRKAEKKALKKANNNNKNNDNDNNDMVHDDDLEERRG